MGSEQRSYKPELSLWHRRHSTKCSTKHMDTGHISQKSKAGRKWYLCQRPRSSLYNKFCVAELTVTCVGGGQPFFQAALVHGAQCSCAVTRGKQSLPISTFVTDSTDGTVTTEADRQTEGNHGQTGSPGNSSLPPPPLPEPQKQVTLWCLLSPSSQCSHLCDATPFSGIHSCTGLGVGSRVRKEHL